MKNALRGMTPMDALQRVRASLARMSHQVRLRMIAPAELGRLRRDVAILPGCADLDLRAALALVQKREGLPITGFPDKATRDAVSGLAVGARSVFLGGHDPAAASTVTLLLSEVRRLEDQLQALARVTGGAPLPPLADGDPPHRRTVSWMSVSHQSDPVRLVFEGPVTQYVLQRLAADGVRGYEPDTMATVLAAVEVTKGNFHDVGANIGVFAMLVKALVPDADVTAFEPGPQLADTCRRIAALNHLDVRVEQVALGDRDGEASFYMSPTDTSNSLRQGFRPAVDVLEVSVTRLDTWLAARSTDAPTVLKIDTESTEPDVLAGAEDLVGRSRPWFVVEVLKDRTEERLEAWCRDHGYRSFHIREGGPVAADRIVGDGSYEHLNWLFAPHELPPAFWEAFAAWRVVLGNAVTIEVRG